MIKRVGSHNKWFEGAAIFAPSTNNSLESFNGNLKIYKLQKEVLKINDFIFKSKEIFKEQSLRVVATKPQYTYRELENIKNTLYKISFTNHNFTNTLFF